MIIEAPKST